MCDRKRKTTGLLLPQIERLNPSNLEVRYRASENPQLLTIYVHGVPKFTWSPDYATRISRIQDIVNSGLAGGVLFAPELCRAEIVEGPMLPDQGTGPEFTWKLRVQAVDPRWFAIALDRIADSWSTAYMPVHCVEPMPEYYPQKVSLVGELPLDESKYSAKTEDVLKWIRDPSDAYSAWPEMPFKVKESPAVGEPILRIKTPNATDTVAKSLKSRMFDLTPVFNAHPLDYWPNLSPKVAATKTQLTAKWDKNALRCPGSIARGPILNLLRAFHFQVAPLTQVELMLPEG